VRPRGREPVVQYTRVAPATATSVTHVYPRRRDGGPSSTLTRLGVRYSKLCLANALNRRQASLRTALSFKSLHARPATRVVGRNRGASRATTVRATAAAAAHTYYLHGGTVLDIYTVGSQVTLRANPPQGCADSWHIPDLALHWGVSSSPDGPWTVPNTRPPGTPRIYPRLVAPWLWRTDAQARDAGTEECNGLALETPFTAERPGAPNGGPHSIAVTLDNSTHVSAPAPTDFMSTLPPYRVQSLQSLYRPGGSRCQ
jgi:hypothetical protein